MPALYVYRVVLPFSIFAHHRNTNRGPDSHNANWNFDTEINVCMRLSPQSVGRINLRTLNETKQTFQFHVPLEMRLAEINMVLLSAYTYAAVQCSLCLVNVD